MRDRTVSEERRGKKIFAFDATETKVDRGKNLRENERFPRDRKRRKYLVLEAREIVGQMLTKDQDRDTLFEQSGPKSLRRADGERRGVEGREENAGTKFSNLTTRNEAELTESRHATRYAT